MTARSAAWRGWAEGMDLPPDLSVVDWAQEKRVLVAPDPEPGPWRNDRTPYLVGIMECCSPDHPARHITAMMGVQIGKTSFALNVVGWAVYTGGHSIVIGTPAESDAKEWSARLMAMLAASGGPESRLFESRSKSKAGNMSTRMLFRGNGTQIKLGWAGSPRTFAMTQASIVIGDEIDRWSASAREGSPEDLLINRVTTAGRPKVLLMSSPVVESLSRIYPRYKAGDQRMFFVPCPRCNRFQVLSWDRMNWPRRPEAEETAGQAFARCSEIGMYCIACEQLIEERAKGKMLADGCWLATQGREDFVSRGFDSGDLKDMGPLFSEMGRSIYASFHLSSLYAPWGWQGASWPSLAMDYERSRGIPEKHKAFVTTRLAVPWKDNAQRPEAEAIADMRADYPAGVVPHGAAIVTVAVDVQPDRLEYEALAHGPQGETWSIEYDVIPGNVMMPEPWQALGKILERNWPTAGGMTLPTHAMGIDSAHVSGQVYDFARDKSRPIVNQAGYQIRNPRTVVLLKGSTRGWNRPIESYSPYEAAMKRGGLYIFHVGTSFLKMRLYEQLRNREGSRCHWPNSYQLPYFYGLTAEELQVIAGKSVFKPISNVRNEPLDCRVYNMALADMLQLHSRSAQEWEAAIARTIRNDEPSYPQPQRPRVAGRLVRGYLE